MNQQPTVILIKFTDYLNNRDSLAFLRLSHSLWSAHRSPSGRYRLKPELVKSNNPNDHSFVSGPRPFALPHSFFSGPLRKVDEFSQGNFLVEAITLASLEDFLLFKGSTDNQNDRGERRVFDSLKILVIDFDYLAVKALKNSGAWESHDLQLFPPTSLQTLRMANFASLEKMFPPLAEEAMVFPHLKTLDFIDLLTEQEELGNFLQHSIIRNNHIETIFLPDNFNSPLEKNSLPNSLIELFLGDNFSSFIHPDSLPETLEILRFSRYCSFNHPLPPLPSSLRRIEFGHYFNQNLEAGLFPSTMEKISLIGKFHQPFIPFLPPALKDFSFPLIDSSIEVEIPSQALESLSITVSSGFSSQQFPKCPKSLKTLTFCGHFNFPIDSSEFFPPHLRIINFSSWFSSPLKPGIFPSTVEEINLPAFNHPLELSVFPSGLKKISFGAYNQPLPVGIFPDGIREIDLSSSYSHGLAAGLFPSSVRKLQISTDFPLLPGVFPEGVESIVFHNGFSHPLQPGIFPCSLRRLIFEDFGCAGVLQEDFVPGCLPEFLTDLEVGPHYYSLMTIEALPDYFRPDYWPSHEKFCRLPSSVSSAFPVAFAELANYLLHSIGTGEFSMAPLRVPISQNAEYIAISRLEDGERKTFVVNKKLIEQRKEGKGRNHQKKRAEEEMVVDSSTVF